MTNTATPDITLLHIWESCQTMIQPLSSANAGRVTAKPTLTAAMIPN